MEEENKSKNVDHDFIGLIVSISASAWQHLGKIPNPITTKTEKNLEAAQMSIDLLEMLKEKTKGNLSAAEQKFLDNTLTDLRLNYVDEMKSDQPADVPKEQVKEPDKENKPSS